LLFITKDFLPKQWVGADNTSHHELMNLNEQIRICKYDNKIENYKLYISFRYEPGQFFAAHFDGVYKRSYMEQSKLTIMAYLNDSFTGGNTNFLDDRSKPHAITCALKPETGIFLLENF
jgi:hypothetical protein